MTRSLFIEQKPCPTLWTFKVVDVVNSNNTQFCTFWQRLKAKHLGEKYFTLQPHWPPANTSSFAKALVGNQWTKMPLFGPFSLILFLSLYSPIFKILRFSSFPRESINFLRHAFTFLSLFSFIYMFYLYQCEIVKKHFLWISFFLAFPLFLHLIIFPSTHWSHLFYSKSKLFRT